MKANGDRQLLKESDITKIYITVIWRLFALVRQFSNSSWNTSVIKTGYKSENVKLIEGNFCEWGVSI